MKVLILCLIYLTAVHQLHDRVERVKYFCVMWATSRMWPASRPVSPGIGSTPPRPIKDQRYKKVCLDVVTELILGVKGQGHSDIRKIWWFLFTQTWRPPPPPTHSMFPLCLCCILNTVPRWWEPFCILSFSVQRLATAAWQLWPRQPVHKQWVTSGRAHPAEPGPLGWTNRNQGLRGLREGAPRQQHTHTQDLNQHLNSPG